IYLTRFMQEMKKCHWIAAKHLLRYVRGTVDFGLEYHKNTQFFLQGYTDSDYAGSVDDRKSTSRYVFHLGSGPISWVSKKQYVVDLSSTEAEYRGARGAVCEVIWLCHILADIGIPEEKTPIIHCDNQGVLKLVKNPIFHERTKHIE
ncbi:hypothetical protein KI387_036434, partial [Taxus chinensis]